MTIPNQPARRSAGRLDDATVGGDLGRETGALPRGEVVHAAVVAVVHVVVETVDPKSCKYVTSRVDVRGDLRIRSSTGAGIARGRAAEDGSGLRGGVADGITWGAASSLEGVV